MIEYIGKVPLMLGHYKGTDGYSDGEIEDKLLEIVQKYTENEYGRIIAEQAGWPVLYHLSAARANLVSWLDFRKEEDTVLEIGAGCGAITGMLAEKAKEVACVELSRRRSTINAARHRGCGNVCIYVGNFADIEPDLPCYDTATLIGVLEYAKSYIPSDTPCLDLLKRTAQHLKPEGRLVLAIENRLGMKYWAGCPEDHTGRCFDSIEGYPDNNRIVTFSRGELKGLLEDAGYGSIQFYYPYPDYKFPDTIYSDAYLPQKGCLAPAKNMSGDRITLFDESKAYDSILDAGLYPEFANSFLVIAKRRL